MVKKLLHTRYRVIDLDKTVAFYRDVLGLEETRRHTSGRGSQLVFFKAPGSEEEIALFNAPAGSTALLPSGPLWSRVPHRLLATLRHSPNLERVCSLDV